jgi:hypothetical protein
MRRVTLSALVLTSLCVLVAGSAVASDLNALWMSLTPEGPAQTDFPSGTQTVYVVFDYTDFVAENVRVVVSDYKGTVIFQDTQTFVGSGVGSIPVSNGQSAFPDGPYVTTLYFAGQYLTRAVEWTVGGIDSPPMPTAFPPARLEVKPAALVFSASQGGANPPPQRVLITNNTASASVWHATTDAPWLALTPAGGETPALLSISVDSTGLPAGAYHGTVTITADGIENSPQAVDVALAVSPPQGTTTLDLTAIAEGTGWVVSDEVSGNHFGEEEIRVGVQAGREHLGGLQFSVSEIPDASSVRAAAVVLTGLRWEAQPPAGDWILELLDSGDLAEEWTDRGYADIATAAARVTLLPDHGVDNLGADTENVWHLDTAGLAVLESLIRDGDSALLRLRYLAAPGTEGDDSLFVWSATGLLRVNFEASAGPAQTATPATSATGTPPETAMPTVATATQTATAGPPTATPALPPPPPPPGGKQPPGGVLADLAWTVALLGALGVVVQRLTRTE